jgi:hypothetical protein
LCFLPYQVSLRHENSVSAQFFEPSIFKHLPLQRGYMMISTPSVDGVRLATLADLDRIAIVAAAAFFWSPTFKFQRPRYRDFPSDTVASYLTEYAAGINDPACAVLVAEDDLETDEAEHVYDALRSVYQSPRPRQRGIVGVCSLTLKPGSCYTDCFQPAGKHVMQ